ncbi:MAG: PilZ domain-containing protein [Acidobacteriota bacterium]|nr:PilZ domain-containing protein [Acidobacteriota bacterium]
MSEEKRKHGLRIKQRLEVEIWHNSPRTQAFVEDLSESGMFIDTNMAIHEGADIQFSFRIPGIDPETPISGAGTVMWSDPTGLGIKFLDLSEEDRKRIRFFVGAVFFNQPPELL